MACAGLVIVSTRRPFKGVFALAQSQVIGEGKTVEEAIKNGLAKLQVARESVHTEIIEEPSTGFFGRRSGKAMVRLTLKATPEIVTQPEPLGALSVRDGKLVYRAEGAAGSVMPKISFGSQLQIRYQGIPVEKEVELTQGIEPLEIILPEGKEPSLQYEIIVDTKKIKAHLLWKRSPGLDYSLASHPPTNHLKLAVIQHPLEARALEMKDVEELVKVEGLKSGLRMAELTSEMLKAPQSTQLIAVGKEPGVTRQPSIKYIFQDQAAAVDEDAIRIDHYEVHGTEGVQEGAILAVKDPGQLGEQGVDVYGEPIFAEPLKPVQLSAGEGVALSEDGLQAIAVTAGLPSLQSGVIRVTKVFELTGDADVATGNITMDGDIIIRGNVLENVKVQSKSGIIVVNGLVSGGTLRTGGSITVLRNVVRSQLYAGGASVTTMRLLNMIRRISSQLESLAVAYEAIVSQADNIPFENLMRHLIELKFSDLPKDVKELSGELDQISKVSGDEALDFAALKKAMQDRLFIQDLALLKLNDIGQLQQLRQGVAATIAELEIHTAVESDVKVGYLQNSTVEASGGVEVSGKGCFYSTILAGTGFKIANGVFRGGQVTVNSGKIAAKELGGPTGIATTAQILRMGDITATLVHPNVSVVIGDQSFKFDETTSMVKVNSPSGILAVYSGSNKIHG